jgi:hypothetical protein
MKRCLVAWLVDENLLVKDFGPYGIILKNICVFITVAVVMLFTNFGLYGIKFVTMYIY